MAGKKFRNLCSGYKMVSKRLHWTGVLLEKCIETEKGRFRLALCRLHRVPFICEINVNIHVGNVIFHRNITFLYDLEHLTSSSLRVKGQASKCSTIAASFSSLFVKGGGGRNFAHYAFRIDGFTFQKTVALHTRISVMAFINRLRTHSMIFKVAIKIILEFIAITHISKSQSQNIA